MTPAETEDRLRLIRLRQERLGHVLFGFVPAMLVAGFVGGQLGDAELALIWVAIGYGILVLVYSLRLALTECPRCEKLYHWNYWSNPWTQRCLNCGLSLKGANAR